MPAVSPTTAKTLTSLVTELKRWWGEEALPTWYFHGVDWSRGGYFETLDMASGVMLGQGSVRRGRVVARQIYVFDLARRCQVIPRTNEVWIQAVDHGLSFLIDQLYLGEGGFARAFRMDSGTHDSTFSLYEHAFYLFALARVSSSRIDSGKPLAKLAAETREFVRQKYAHSSGGFWEQENDPELLFRANPHMHLLEAAIEWIVVDSVDGDRWLALGQELVALALTRFIDSESGILHEHFNADWTPLSNEHGRFFEPGHHFEWAWLLLKWAELGLDEPEVLSRCRSVAIRLVQIAEGYGVDRHRNVAMNEIWDSHAAKDPEAKLWPQTERVKAWCAMAESATSEFEFATATRHLCRALQGMMQYFRTDVSGLWQEVAIVRQSDSLHGLSFTDEPCKASSFYHVACAIETVLLYHANSFVSREYSCSSLGNPSAPTPADDTVETMETVC